MSYMPDISGNETPLCTLQTGEKFYLQGNEKVDIVYPKVDDSVNCRVCNASLGSIPG